MIYKITFCYTKTVEADSEDYALECAQDAHADDNHSDWNYVEVEQEGE